MLIVWGSRAENTHIGYSGDDHKCFHCDTIGKQSIFTSVEQGYFFFIPLPIKRTRYYYKCSVRGCDGITELSKEQLDLWLSGY